MPLIKALIKPPDEDLNVPKPKKPQHPYYKRPGKGHNHDSCDACGEGGDLICCDRCPASFHLGCYDPPLDETDIPAGLWLCRECHAADENKPSSSRSSRAQSPADKSDGEKKTRSLRNNRTNSKKKSKEDDDEVKKETERQAEAEKELSPMEVLVKAAKIMNPRQFELPRELRIPCIFPGTEKEGAGEAGAGAGAAGGECFVCGASCRVAPLLRCDYCPLLYHQDCLEPPLTALPTGRWMCPNHVEQYIDWKLVNSISATERVALWDRFAGPVDQHAIKIDFLRRARNPNPRFRIKIPAHVRGRVRVPPMVRSHYRRPAPLLPARREHVRCRNVLKNLGLSSVLESEGEECRKHTICMNMDCPSYSGAAPCPAAAPHPPAPRPAQASASPGSSDYSDSDLEYYTASVKRRKATGAEDKGFGRRARADRVQLRADEHVEQLLALVDEQLKKLDERLVKLLAWQRLQQVLAGEACAGWWRDVPLSRAVARALARHLTRGALAAHGFRHVSLPSELLSRADRERIARSVWGAAPAPRPPPRAAPRAAPSPPPPRARALSDACVRATLCAINSMDSAGPGDSLGRPVPMRLSSLTVGSDSGCDVTLDPALCRCVSRNHAVIFMDEVSGHFELINYSEFGSRVNGVLYTCDPLAAAPAPAPAADDALPRALRDVVKQKDSPLDRIKGDITEPTSWCSACSCGAGAGAAAGAWEGSALVPHGALLQFGCRLYVFSITDAKPFPYEQIITDPAL